jgi:hypothetical protein
MPNQDTPRTGERERRPMLPVGAVVAIASEWVDLYASRMPGFAGAYLWGGITALPADAPFPLYRDVDVVVVVSTGANDETQEVLYRGLMLEVILKNVDAHRDAEVVLADPSSGPNIAATRILADPTGLLGSLQRAVAADFPRRRWVEARCAAEQATAAQQLAAMRRVTNPIRNQEPFWPVWVLLNALSGLLAVADLKRPTTRRTLSLLGELLRAHGRPELHEDALLLWGAAHLSRSDVQAMLHQSVIAFDRSVEVYQTPTSYGFTIRAHLRPYLLDATEELIGEGQYREATFWIMTLVTESYLVLQNDAPEDEKPVFAAQLETMLETLGYTSIDAWGARIALAERLTQHITAVVAGLAARHPE